jgi:hypothetical protein
LDTIMGGLACSSISAPAVLYARIVSDGAGQESLRPTSG